MTPPGLFDGTPLERPVTCAVCAKPIDDCTCPRGADGAVCRPKDQRLVVRREKRRKGKTVTLVSGFDAAASDLPAIAQQLRGLCAAGGSVDGDAVEVQGDHVERVAGHLRGLGYPVRLG